MKINIYSIRCSLYLISIVSSLYVFLILTATNAYAQTTYYLHQDHNGNNAVVTKSAQVVSKTAYYPFGVERNRLGNSPTEMSFTSQVSDLKQTSLYYFKARYYSPYLGRFTQPDTFRDGLNRYAYVGNNPINKTDPSGFCDPENWLCKLWNFGTSRTWTVVSDYISNPEVVNDNLPSTPPPSTFNPDSYSTGDCGSMNSVSCYLRSSDPFNESQNVPSLSKILGGERQSQFDSEVGWLVMDPNDEVADMILNSVASDIMESAGNGDVIARTTLANVWIMNNYDYDSSNRANPYISGGGSATLGSILSSDSMVCNENAVVLHLLLAKMNISSQVVDITLPGGFGHMGVKVYDPQSKKYYYFDPSFDIEMEWDEWLNMMQTGNAEVDLRDYTQQSNSSPASNATNRAMPE